MISLLAFAAAAVLEIAGCFSFWAWLRLEHSPLFVLPGMAALAGFAYPSAAAGLQAGRAGQNPGESDMPR